MNHEVLNVFQKSFIEISSYIASHNNLSLGSIIPNQNNQTGDQVKKLDQIANQIIIDSLMNCSLVRTIASEENKHLISTGYKKAPFLVSFDPLDGSSNIDVNITTGSIFAIFLYSLDDNNIINGHDIVMSGYCLYGASTQLIVAQPNKRGVKIFQLSPKYQEFKLLVDQYQIPIKGKIYAINQSNQDRWLDKRLHPAVNFWIKEGYTQRWVASLVADTHRTLIKGGFFCYPGDKKNVNGKIRLLYEAYPMALIIKQAGGHSTNGYKLILDIEFPWMDIHQKTPIYLSSSDEMAVLVLQGERETR